MKLKEPYRMIWLLFVRLFAIVIITLTINATLVILSEFNPSNEQIVDMSLRLGIPESFVFWLISLFLHPYKLQKKLRTLSDMDDLSLDDIK